MYDIIILGGGCSGLALAHALGKQAHTPKVLVLEARTAYTHDKTWCFFANTASTWTELAEKSWNSWSYHHDNTNKSITHTSKTWRYYYLPSERYYNYMLKSITSSPDITIKLGQTVTNVDNDKTVYTEDNIYTAAYIIDTRPPTRPACILSQVFYGMYIDQQPYFSADKITLMHNMRTDSFGFRFNYVLPVHDNKMLFEHTRFSTKAYSKAQMQSECYSELKRLGITYDNVYKDEYGILPMGYLGAPTSTNGGLRAGLLRQATGYGFLRIQAWAEGTACMLTQQTVKKNKQNLVNWMDRLFLHTLRSNMTQCPEYFITLAKYCPADTLVRFLSDKASTYDCLRVMLSLPPRSFMYTLATKSTQSC